MPNQNYSQNQQRVYKRRPQSKGEALPISEVIRDFVHKLDVNPDLAVLRAIQLNWEKLAGKLIAKRVWPAKLERGTLTLYVENSVWLAEVTRMHKPQLLRKLQAHAQTQRTAIKDLRLIVNANGVRQGQGDIKKNG